MKLFRGTKTSRGFCAGLTVLTVISMLLSASTLAIPAAPFTFDGAGTFCWQMSNLGSYIIYTFSSALPAKTNGYWYVYYVGNYAWSHFEAK